MKRTKTQRYVIRLVDSGDDLFLTEVQARKKFGVQVWINILSNAYPNVYAVRLQELIVIIRWEDCNCGNELCEFRMIFVDYDDGENYEGYAVTPSNYMPRITRAKNLAESMKHEDSELSLNHQGEL